MTRNSFVLYTSYLKHIELLTIEQRGMLLTAIFKYASGAEPDGMDDMTRMAFSFIKSDMDENAEKYQKTVNARRESGKKGGRPKSSESDEKQKKQMLLDESKDKQKNPVYEDEYVNVNDKDKKISIRRFTPPTLEEVQGYIQEQGYVVDAHRFIDFYSSKGWMVGKNKMKDWRAAVRGWAARDKPKKTGFNNFSDSGADWDDLAYQVMQTQ